MGTVLGLSKPIELQPFLLREFCQFVHHFSLFTLFSPATLTFIIQNSPIPEDIWYHTNRLPSKVVDVPFLEMFKASLDGALGNLT